MSHTGLPPTERGSTEIMTRSKLHVTGIGEKSLEVTKTHIETKSTLKRSYLNLTTQRRLSNLQKVSKSATVVGPPTMISFPRIRFSSRKVGNINLANRRREPSRMKSLFRRSRSNDWENWADFHKKYQSDVYRKSANNQYNNNLSKSMPSHKSTPPGDSGFFTKMMMDSSNGGAKPKTAQRRGSLGGGQSRRRASIAF